MRYDLNASQRSGAAIRDLDPAVVGTAMKEMRTKVFYVYITASGPRGVLYVGMTSDLAGRAWQHRNRVMDGFTKRYWVDRLVYFEHHETADSAARRERALKRWRRDWKIELVERSNPTWADLFPEVVAAAGFEL